MGPARASPATPWPVLSIHDGSGVDIQSISIDSDRISVYKRLGVSLPIGMPLGVASSRKSMILLDFRSSTASDSWMHAYGDGRPRPCMHRNSIGIDGNTLYIHPRTIVDR